MNRCGYTSMPTFSRTVRRWWGVSPQHMRILGRKSGDIGKYAL
jgi:AraC-like DNA-binding protein